MKSRERIAIKNRVIKFVAEQCGGQPNEIDENTDLYRDLNIIGDDVDDLFQDFSKEFNFPIDEIDISGCFPNEPNMATFFSDIFFRPKQRVRVKHLIDAVLLKKWPDLEKI